MIRLLPYAEPHAQHLFLSRGQGGKYFARLLGEVQIDHCIHRRRYLFIFYEIGNSKLAAGRNASGDGSPKEGQGDQARAELCSGVARPARTEE